MAGLAQGTQDMLKLINETEKQAENIILEAQERAQQDELNAVSQAEKLVEQAREKATLAKASGLDAANVQGQEQMKKYDSQGQEQKAKVVAIAKANMSQAVDYICRKVVN